MSSRPPVKYAGPAITEDQALELVTDHRNTYARFVQAVVVLDSSGKYSRAGIGRMAGLTRPAISNLINREAERWPEP